MNKKLLVGMGTTFLVLAACSLGSAVATPTVPDNPPPVAIASQTPVNTLPPYPTNLPTETATATPDPCTAYVTEFTKIAAKFDEDMVKVKADVQNHNMDELSWDWSQILNFAQSAVEALQPPPQFAGINQNFLAEITAYADGASAYLQADPNTGAAKFMEGDALGQSRSGAKSSLTCSN